MDFFLPKSEELSHEALGQCMLCNSNQCLDLSKLWSHLQKTWHSLEQVNAIFQATAQVFVQTVKFPSVISRK